MLVQPERPVSKLITRLFYTDSLVIVRREYARDGLNNLLRKLDLRWDRANRRWERAIILDRTGPALDRCAEIGRELLAAGYPVEFPDEMSARMAVDGSYTEEHTRWILLRATGDFAGWFAITWSRREDWYRQARSLSGSRYSSPHVVIPPDAFDELEDFADINDFRFGDDARTAIDAARAKRRDALVVNLESKPRRKPVKTETYEVANELLDDAYAAPDPGC